MVKAATTLAMLVITLSGGLIAQTVAGTQDQKVTSAQDRWECPPSVLAIKNPIELNDQSAAAGQKLVFSNGCVDCHGAGGFGDGPGAASIHPRPSNWHSNKMRAQSDACLFWKLTTGRRPMPGSANIPERQRWDIINYIRNLQGN